MEKFRCPAYPPSGQIEILVEGRQQNVAAGTTIARLFGARRIGREGIVAGLLNQHLVGLETVLHHDVELAPVRGDDPIGEGVIRRAARHVLHAVAARRFPDLELEIGQSLGGGYFYEILQPLETINLEELARQLNLGLEETIKADLPFLQERIPVEALERYVHDPYHYKASLIRIWPSAQLTTISLNGYRDVQHGVYPPSTGYLADSRVDVRPYPPGLILQCRGSDAPEAVESRLLFSCYQETRRWDRSIGISAIGDLNRAALDDRFADVVRVSEALHEKKIAGIADEISRSGKIRLVFVAGPSSSGKTTFVRRLSVQLRVNGVHPEVLSLDDYYRDRDDTPRDDQGEPDFERLEALDVELLTRHMESLCSGEEVLVPRYDFVRGVRTHRDTWRPLSLTNHRVLLVEGLHGLNPRLTRAVPKENQYRVFVSALTQLIIDEHNRLQTSKVRLLRRVVRDRRFRGTRAAETITMWPRVRSGEERHIFPFQDQADAMFNSSLVYETAVLKIFAERYLMEVPRDHPAQGEAFHLLRFLELFVPVFPDHIPANSVLREFIGGSGFSY